MNKQLNADIPVIPGSDGPVTSVEEVATFGKSHGYPIIIKASLAAADVECVLLNSEEEVAQAFERAKSEAKSAFGSDEMYVEKYIDKPKHIEVQILGDTHGNVVHLYERDCSIQRRHQKVVEIAPSISLEDGLREEICDAAVKLMKNIDYFNAGTVEFLVADGRILFHRSKSYEFKLNIRLLKWLQELILSILKYILQMEKIYMEKMHRFQFNKTNSTIWICYSVACNNRRPIK